MTPTSYAAQLATYISDPSTIRIRTLEWFGRAPSVDQCRNLRNRVLQDRAAAVPRVEQMGGRFTRMCRKHPYEESDYIIDINGNEQCATCLHERQEAVRKADEERERLWREERAARAAARRAAERLKMAREELERDGILDSERPRLATDTMKAVAAMFGITVDDIRGPNRSRKYVDARAVCVRLFRDGERPLSYPQIARLMGKECHSSIINLADTWDTRCKVNPRLWDIFDALRGVA